MKHVENRPINHQDRTHPWLLSIMQKHIHKHHEKALIRELESCKGKPQMTLFGDAQDSNGYIISAPATRRRSFPRGMSSSRQRSHSSGGRSRPRTPGGKNFRSRFRLLVVPARTGNVEGVRPRQLSLPLLGSTRFLPEATPDSNNTRARQRFAINGRGPRPVATEMHANFCMTLRQLLLRPGTKSLSHLRQSILRMKFRNVTILGMGIMMNVIMRTLQMLLPSHLRKVNR